MKKKQVIDLDFFELISLSWVLLTIFGLIIAILGIFHSWLIIGFFLIETASCFWLVQKNFLKIKPFNSNDEKIALGVLIFIGLILFNFTTPTIFGGRDQGSLSNAAILLTKNHNLVHTDNLVQEFGEIYGEGRALNFPGFNYEKSGENYFLRSQFLPGYISWLAICYSLFGLVGLAFANFIPFIVFLFSFYLVSKFFTKENSFSLSGLALILYSFPVFIFFKFTLSEIYFASFLWLTLHFLFRFIEDKSYQNYSLIFIPLLITPFVRVEAIAMIFTLTIILIFIESKKLIQPKYQLWPILIGILFSVSIFINTDFFVDTGKSFTQFIVENSNSSQITNPSALKTKSFLPDDWKNFYLFKVLFNYNILSFLILGGAVIIALFKKRFYQKLIPFFFLGPSLIYLFDANISLDHPWMLRRFVFAVLPLGVLYSIILFESISFRFFRFSWSLVIILFLYSYLLSSPFSNFGQNQLLFEKTTTLNQEFKQNDLILISRLSTGNGWNLISEPLRNIYQKQAVYFFNPNDLHKINYQQFKNIYLVTSDEQEELELFSQLPKEQVSKHELINQIIKVSKDANSGPAIETYKKNILIFKINSSDINETE